ncbi:two-component system, NarL family, sensor kinase [Thermoflexales bacterium]|nr:two-component system, NarL family, sensor kinase [Thermoflexales bacterium]
MSRLKLATPITTLLPQATALRLLRIMLSIALLPTFISVPPVWAGLGANYAVIMLSIMWPIGAAWLFVVLPGLDRRLGQRYLPIALVVTIAAQTLESSLVSFAAPPLELRLRSFNPMRMMPLVDMRLVEPLFLLLVAVVIAAWAYGRRGAWLAAGLSGVLMITGGVVEDLMTGVARPGALLLFGAISPWSILSAIALRLPLLVVAGYIVGTLAEQERKHTHALSSANVKLREQALAMEQLATARERNRLARDLHDTLAHSLAGLVVQLQAIDTLFQAEPEAARSELAKARQLAQAGLQETRHAIQDLRMNPIEDLGLARALERTALDFGDRAGVQIELHVSDPQAAISDEAAAQVYFIAKEALNNIERHAGAHCVEVTLARRNGQVWLTVRDDGRGFDESEVDAERFGLQGMYERAEMIGAQLSVESRVGQGTTVQLTMSNEQ